VSKPLFAELANFANDMNFVLSNKLITKHTLIKLYIAKCYDLRIVVSRVQLPRFFEIFE